MAGCEIVTLVATRGLSSRNTETAFPRSIGTSAVRRQYSLTPRNHRAEVFWRYVLNDSLLWTEYVSTISLAMMAAAIAYSEQSRTGEDGAFGLVALTLDQTNPFYVSARV